MAEAGRPDPAARFPDLKPAPRGLARGGTATLGAGVRSLLRLSSRTSERHASAIRDPWQRPGAKPNHGRDEPRDDSLDAPSRLRVGPGGPILPRHQAAPAVAPLTGPA